MTWLIVAALLAGEGSVAEAGKLFTARKYDEALKALDAAGKDDAASLRLRGMVQFMRGKFEESSAAFDRELKLDPKAYDEHWMRGLSLYYVGRYKDGVKQFEASKVSAGDVENTFWHWMCHHKQDGEKAARERLLKTEDDRRAPMNEVLGLIQGKLKPADVLAAAEKDGKKAALFYGHLYLGLYHDVKGDRKKALEHLELAAGKYHIGNYMPEVARAHRDWLKAMK